MDDNFEFAIKKDIRNNPIVREVDSERHRDMLRSVFVVMFAVLVALFSAWQHFELLRHGYDLEEMRRQRAVEDEVASHLRLEIDTLKAPTVIERIATEQLHMVAPAPHEVIELVTAPASPPRSAVARR